MLLLSVGAIVAIAIAVLIVIIIIAIVAWAIKMYNKLVDGRNKVKNSWSQVDVQLKRRFDLIPNLVETVKGYTKHESETLEAVIKARNTYVSATLPEDQMKADGELTKAISKLFALTESYPELKANTNFQALQQELTETESKIASARQFYNDTVMVYNNKVDMVPSNIIASLFRFEKEAFFEANETERQNVQVKF